MTNLTNSKFYCMWRPLSGWAATIGFFMQFVIIPIVEVVAALYGHPVTLPRLDTMPLVTLVVGGVGFSGLRTIEKLNGISSGGT